MEIVIGIAIVAAIVVILIVTTNQKSEPPPSQVPGGGNTCFTYCIGFVEFQCGDNKLIGPCFGVWDCKAEIGAHECK